MTEQQVISFPVAEPQEMEAALRRAFVDHRADYIYVVTSRRERFRLESVNYGMSQGWVSGDMDTRDDQATALICRLTDAGRAHFGLAQKGGE
jgi:hypothetical protein